MWALWVKRELERVLSFVGSQQELLATTKEWSLDARGAQRAEETDKFVSHAYSSKLAVIA